MKSIKCVWEKYVYELTAPHTTPYHFFLIFGIYSAFFMEATNGN